LTGAPDEIAKVAAEYNAYYARVPLGNGDYEMDHSTDIYVMDRRGRFSQFIAYGDPDSAVMPVLRKIVQP
jgi:protein SCO1/2